jgi:hypothetical protein
MIVLIKTIKITIDYGYIGELRFLQIFGSKPIASRDSVTAEEYDYDERAIS